MKITPVEGLANDTNGAQNMKLQERSPHSWLEEDSEMKIEDYALYRILRPVLLTMKVCGFGSLREKGLCNNPPQLLHMCYTVFSLLMVYSNLSLYAAGIRSFRTINDFVITGSILLWYIHLAFQGMLLCVMCIRRKDWQQLFDMYEQTTQGIWRLDQHAALKKRIYIYVVLGWIWILLNIVNASYIAIKHTVNADSFVFYLQVVSAIYTYAIWIPPFVLFTCLTDTLITGFKNFNQKLSETIRNNPTYFYDSLSGIRDMHRRLSNLVVAADSVLNQIAAVIIMTNLTMICCSLYSIIYSIYYLDDPIGMLASAVWFSTEWIILFGSMGLCAMLKEEVNAT